MYRFLPAVLVFLFYGCIKEDIKIGAIMPLTGDIASYGKMCRGGVELAIEKINKNGGIKGRKLVLLVEDNEGDEEKTITALEKLDKNGVTVIIGPLTTKNTIRIGKFADDKKIPLISPTATGIDVTRDREYVWRTAYRDDFQGAMLARYARKKLNAKTASVFVDIHNSYSVSLSQCFERTFKDLGGRIFCELTFTEGDSSFTHQLQRIIDDNPDCVFVPAFYREAGLMIKQAREMGLTMPFIGGDGWDSPELKIFMGDKSGTNYYATQFFYAWGAEPVQRFVNLFRTKYRKEPQTFAALGYDTAMLIAEILKKSRTITRDAIPREIKKISYMGVTGTIDFTVGKDPRRSLMLLKIENGETPKVEEVL